MDCRYRGNYCCYLCNHFHHSARSPTYHDGCNAPLVGLLLRLLLGTLSSFTLCCGGDLATTSTARSKRSHASLSCEISVTLDLAMPQPLNRVIPNAYFRHDPNVLDNQPKLAILVAKIFAHWGLIEYRLSLLFIRRTRRRRGASTCDVYSTLTAQHLQFGALEAAAKAALTPEEFDVFAAAIAVTDSVQTPRNQLAHWIWGSCPELPNALLLAEPKSHKERDREFTLALESGKFDTVELGRLNSYDPANIMVYKDGDLRRAERDLEEASLMAFLLVIYLDGSFRGRRKPLSALRTASRADVFRQLCGQRMFREAIGP